MPAPRSDPRVPDSGPAVADTYLPGYTTRLLARGPDDSCLWGVVPDDYDDPALACPRLIRPDARRRGACARRRRLAQPDAGGICRDRRVCCPGGRVLVPGQPGPAAVASARPGDRRAGAHPGGVRVAPPAVGRRGGGGADDRRCRDRQDRVEYRRAGRGHARRPGGPPAAAVPDHEPQIGRRESHQVRAAGTRRRRWAPRWRCWKARGRWMWRRWPARRWPTAPTCWRARR